MKLNKFARVLGAAVLGLAAASAAQAANVSITGVYNTGLYYLNPSHGDSSFKLAGIGETPVDSSLHIRAKEDLGNGRYVGVNLGTTFSGDTGSLTSSGVLFDSSRILFGNENIEFSIGRFGGFTVAETPYSAYTRLQANLTMSQLTGIAPANITHRTMRPSNTVAFSTRPETGFFLQGYYTNGDSDASGDEETLYDWSDRVHAGQLALGWVGQRLRLGAVYTWEMPGDSLNVAGVDNVRHDDMNAVHLVANYNFGGPSASAVLFFGKDVWRLGAAPDLPAIVGVGDGAAGQKAVRQSSDGLDVQALILTGAYPMGKHRLSGSVGFMQAQWKGVENPDGADDGSMWQAGVVYNYYFSKRTSLYAAASYADGNRMFGKLPRYNQVMATTGLCVRF